MRALFIMWISVVLATDPGPAFACECPKRTTSEKFRASTTVFYGMTESIVRVRDGESDHLKVSTVDRIYLKGDKTVETATTPYSGAECGASVKVPGLYFFFLDKSGRFDKCGTLIDADSVEAKPLHKRLMSELRRMRRKEVQLLRQRDK